MHNTPWTSEKHKQKKQKKPASKAARDIETLISKLSSQTPTPDPNGGCFCLAREHPLSPYIPSCTSCAFILCSLNLPNHLCPSCSSPLLTSPTSLISDLKIKLAQTLENEERERQRLVEEAKRAAGAFPQLSASTITPKTSAPQLRPAHETSHKVLTIPSSGKQKIKIISISRAPTPTSSRPSSGASTPLNEDEYITRVPPPPSTIDYARGKVDPNRPWKNFLLGGDVKYIGKI